MNRLLVVILLSLSAPALAQTQAYAYRANANTHNYPAYGCYAPGCGADFYWALIRQDLTVQGVMSAASLSSTGDLHGATLTADGLMTSSGVSTGQVNATDIYGSSATVTGTVSSAQESTGSLTASSSITTKDFSASGTVTTPAFSADANGNMTFSKPPPVTMTVCASVTSPVSLSTLNTAATVTTLTSPAFKPALPCFVVPPSNLSMNVDYGCRVTAAGAATIYAKSGLVGLSASVGQWCAVVVGS